MNLGAGLPQKGSPSAYTTSSMTSMERWARALLAAVLCVLALAVQGCGGDGDGGTQLAGADMVPADVPLYISLDTDLESEQWQAAQDLLNRFPGKDELLARLRTELAADDVDFERDVRPVLGREIGIVWLDIKDEDAFVGLIQPKDEAKLAALLEKANEPFVHTEIDGWTVVSDTREKLDRFRSKQSGEKLSESDAYTEAVSSLPEDALLKLYVGGPQVRERIQKTFSEEGLPRGIAERFSDLRSAAVALTAEPGGVRFEADLVTGSDLDLDTYEPQLPETLPVGALLYVSFANLDRPARSILDAVAEVIPNFEEQRRQAETAFGFSIENDLLPLLENEGAVAVYADRPLPAVVVALEDPDDKAVQLLDRVGALLELGDEGSTGQEQVEGLTVNQLLIEGVSIFYARVDGIFVASNSRARLLETNRDGPKLSGDRDYLAAREGVDAEGGTIALLYGNLQEGLPYVFGFAEREGETVPEDVRANVEPLRSLLISATQDANRFELSGFLAFE
jgi:hypothetical protein